MALDGSFLRQIKQELELQVLDARVDRIHQISREELVIVLRQRGGNRKLYISAGADAPRIHFTATSFENPKAPPMFCMLLRKYLSGARIMGISQVGLDRILNITFETRNELGDLIQIKAVLEIMGRHSNFILVDEKGYIIDSIKRIDATMSSVRPVLPGLLYTLPPSQDKIILIDSSPEEIQTKIQNSKDALLSKSILACIQGVSPIVCREISNYTLLAGDILVSLLNRDQWDRFRFIISKLIDTIKNYTGMPTCIIDSKKKPYDFSFIDIHQYGGTMFTKTYDSYSQLLDDFYTQRSNIQRMHHRSAGLLKVLSNQSDRIARKLVLQKQELKECADRDKLRIYGDILNANLYSIQKGDRIARLNNFYDENFAEIEIPLDVRKTPSQNAQQYYLEYRKADTAEKKLKELIISGEEEYAYLDTVFDALTRAQTNDELSAIRLELESGGYVQAQRGAKKQKEQRLKPKQYISDDGFTILVGRNNIQNDQLTLKDSDHRDVWFHTKNIPGSHTIVVSDGKDIPESTLNQAAVIAAVNSKAADSSQVPVDYTFVKNVKKPKGSKPGKVIYVSYQTAYVNPDMELEKRLMV